jgi:hypothetical protein
LIAFSCLKAKHIFCNFSTDKKLFDMVIDASTTEAGVVCKVISHIAHFMFLLTVNALMKAEGL